MAVIMAEGYGQHAHHVKIGKPPFAGATCLGKTPRMPKKPLTPGSLPDRQAVASHLIAMREAMDMSQAEIADAIGCNRRDWGRYESTERDLPLAKAWALYKRFSFDLNFLYEGNLDGVPGRHRDAVIRRLNARPEDRVAS